MNQALLEQRLAELPLYSYFFTSPSQLEFSPRVRWICEHECGQYGQSWACPPGVGTVEECQAHCMRYQTCLVIATITEVTDIANLEETLSTRREHEEITDQAAEILRQLGAAPFVHFGWSALPPPGTDAPLCGKPGHQRGSGFGGKRAYVSVWPECGNVDFHAAVLKRRYRWRICTNSNGKIVRYWEYPPQLRARQVNESIYQCSVSKSTSLASFSTHG